MVHQAFGQQQSRPLLPELELERWARHRQCRSSRGHLEQF
jgi:hypothetical protein